MNLQNFVIPKKINHSIIKKESKIKKEIKKESVKPLPAKEKKYAAKEQKKKRDNLNKKSIVKSKEVNETKKIALKKKKVRIKKAKLRKKRVHIAKKEILKKRVKPRAAKKVITKQDIKPKQNSLLSFLSTPQKMPSLEKISKTMKNQEIEKLYKGKFNSFTKGQKEFIKKNLSAIGKITQKYLDKRGYPYFAAKTGQEGINIVEFYLYPNGDITDLKIIKSSSYETLDQNSIDTILEAYKDYPRPKEKTLIRIYVQYNIIY